MLMKKRVLTACIALISSSSVFAHDSRDSEHYYSGAREHQRVHCSAPRQSQAQSTTSAQPAHSSVYTQGPTVTTSPYLGIRSAFDGHDLIVNLSTMNEDLRLLKQRYELKKHLGTLPFIHRPLLELSGDVIGQVGYSERFNGDSNHTIELTGARFDILAEVSAWALGYISIDYDNSPLPSALPGSGVRFKNSNIFLKRSFITIGDLDCSPVYFSIGQMFVPFGRYSNGMLTTPLTASVAKTNARAALLGFYHEGFYASTYAFRGDSRVGDSGINQWGVNAGYEFKTCDFNGEFGAGYIANIADSIGMQCPSNREGFKGFGDDASNETLVQRVPAYDVHGKLSYRCLSAIIEFVGATRPFDVSNLSYNDAGARVHALHAELQAKQDILEHTVNLSLSYGRSWDVLALGLPRHSYAAAASTSFWKNTIVSVEYRHDRNYEAGDTAGGTNAVPNPVVSTGGSRNSVLGQIGVYF